jgi:hypothetical protein
LTRPTHGTGATQDPAQTQDHVETSDSWWTPKLILMAVCVPLLAVGFWAAGTLGAFSVVVVVMVMVAYTAEWGRGPFRPDLAVGPDKRRIVPDLGTTAGADPARVEDGSQSAEVEAGAAERRAAWHSWVEREIGGTGQAIDAATDAVVHALVSGRSIEEAMAAGHAAANAPDQPTAARSATPILSDQTHLRGQVASFRQRNELMGTAYGSVWDFRVDSRDELGRARPPVAIEMRGIKFIGSVADGDWVEIAAEEIAIDWSPGDILHLARLRNLTMNGPVVAG